MQVLWFDVSPWIWRTRSNARFTSAPLSRRRPQSFVPANVGYYTALAASLVGPKGRVIPFEPSPYAFERLRRTVDSNRLENVAPVHAGLSDGAGRLKLSLGVGWRNPPPLPPRS